MEPRDVEQGTPAGPDLPAPAAPHDARFLASAIAAAGLGILALDRSAGAVEYVNEAGREILASLPVTPPEEAVELLRIASLGAAEEKGAAPGAVALSRAIDDRVIGFTLYPAGEALWVFFRDVTERRHASTVAEALQLSDALLGVFTALRHDFGNAVNAAKTSLSVLRNGLGRLPEEAVRRYVDRSLEALARVEEVLGTLRDYGLASSPRPRPVPVGEVVESVALECGARLAERGGALDLEVGDGAAVVVADPRMLEEALCGLLERAAGAPEAREGRRVVLRVEALRGAVSIRVSPCGPTSRPASEKAGDIDDLRLLVVRRLVAQTGGTLDDDGRGAVVTLRRAGEPP